MTYQKALKYIHGLHRFGRKPELTRMELLLEKLGNPQKDLRFIHVAGTNGKGSTTVMLSAILRQAGYHTGTFTSPYVVDFRERIVLDGKMITKKELTDLTVEVAQKAEELEKEYDAPREFEFITALALLYYSRHKCDIVVLEVGLGGRYDATNVIDAPMAAVICPIGLDHTQLLGDTIAQIAGEKCGIIKSGSLVISNPGQEAAAMDVIVESCRRCGCNLTLPQLSQLAVQQVGLDGSSFTYHGREFRVGLVGPHQIGNAITAIDTALALDAAGLPIAMHQIAAGVERAFIPGRLELFPGTPTLLLDGAHNPHGMAAIRETLFAAGVRDVTAVIGMLADKNCQQALDAIAPYLREIIVTTPPVPRALPAEELAKMAEHYCSRITVLPDCNEAVRQAVSGKTGTVLVFGSLYLVSAVRPQLAAEQGTPAAL